MKTTTLDRLKTLIGKECSIMIQPGVSSIETIIDLDLDKNLVIFESLDGLLRIARINLIEEIKTGKKTKR